MPERKRTNQPPQSHALRPDKIIGLNTLKRTLERDFFANASIDIHCSEGFRADLVIHLDCNFGLTESLFHLNNGNWGNFQNCIAGDVRTSPFHTTLLELENDNDILIDIKELSIHLKDTSIIITRLPNCLIQDNLEEILTSVSGNFVHFTKGLTKMPYEIFVPIYEETENSFSHSEKKHHKKPDYLKFWGLYFEGEDEALVYDVKNKAIIEQSDFFLLNQWA
jgi:hypothetical protein